MREIKVVPRARSDKEGRELVCRELFARYPAIRIVFSRVMAPDGCVATHRPAIPTHKLAFVYFCTIYMLRRLMVKLNVVDVDTVRRPLFAYMT